MVLHEISKIGRLVLGNTAAGFGNQTDNKTYFFRNLFTRPIGSTRFRTFFILTSLADVDRYKLQKATYIFKRSVHVLLRSEPLRTGVALAEPHAADDVKRSARGEGCEKWRAPSFVVSVEFIRPLRDSYELPNAEKEAKSTRSS